MDNSGDNRKAVYDYLKAYTNYKDDYDTFNKSFDESDKMRRVYYDKVKETGGYEGSYDEFLNKLGVNNGSAGSVAQQVIDEYDASMRNAKPANPTTTPTNDGSQFALALQEPDWRSDETKLLDEIATSGKATVETLDGEERYPTKPIEVRYDESVQDARNQAVNHKNNAANQLNSLYEEIEKQVDAIPRRVPRPYEAMAGLTEQQLEENRLRAAKRLVEDAKEVIEEAGRKGKTNFIAGLGRGIADKIADPENWNFGITDLADNKYLLDALKKSDKGEELTPAEDKLLQAATTSMAVNYYYSQDLGRGYKAGKTTAESIPFMLEFMINPISQSGSGIAKSLLKYGMKKFGAKAVNRGVTRAAGRLIGDAAAAAGMTATTGAANTLASAYEKQVGNYDYRYDDNGNVIVQKTGDMGEAEALARGFLSTFLENQSEMVFGAFAGAGKALSGIIPSISKLSDNGLVRFYNSIKNAPLAKQLRERAKIGGVVEEYAEEVYNNFANVALGEMTAEDALSVDTNIDTFLGLVPTQLAFSAIGLGGLARENMAARKRLQAFEDGLSDEEKSLFRQLQEAFRSGDRNVTRDYIKATLADNSLTEQEKKDRIFAAKDIVVAQQAEEIEQEQTQEEQEADAAYTEGASADPSTYYERYKASRTAASALEQADANLYETINRYVEDDASVGEVENLLSGLEGETEQLARNYLNSLMQLKGAEDAQMQAAVEAVDVFDKSVSPYVYQNADRTISITTGTYKGRPVYVLPGEGGNVVVAYEDGVKEIALSKDVENQSTSDYDEFIDNYSRDYLTSKEQEFRQKLENHPKTQEPVPGLVLHNGDMTYIVTDVSEDGYVDIVPAYYDPESGRNYAKENSSIQTISRETAMMLQNDYYNAIDNTPENTVQTESGNNLSENQTENESGSSVGESNVSEERQEDTPGQKLANLVASLPKKGNTGEIDYNAMTPQQRYEYTSLTESPETAAQDLQADIKAKQKELDDMQKKLDNSVGGKRTELRDKMRNVRSELSELTDYYQSIATEGQTGSQRQPKGYSANNLEVVSEYLNDVQNEEDYLEWVADESEDAMEVASAYNLAKEMVSRELKLNPWQQELLGTHVNTDSFKRFGDRNLITGTLAKSWLRKDGRDLDILAQELSVQTGMQVTEQDIVDFMLAHPSNRVSQTSDIMTRLAKKFSNIASAEMKFPVGGPESNTGRLYIRLKEAGQKVDELTEQQTREAEGAFAEDIQDNASDIAAVEDAITEEYAALYDEALGRMDEEEADRIAVEELEKESLYEGMTAEELDDIYSSLEYQQYGTEGQRTDSEQVPAEQVQEGTGESETPKNERVLSADDSQNREEDSGTERTEVANPEELLPESPESANERRMNQIIERLDEIEYRLSELEGKTDIFSEAEVITLNNEKDELESEYDGLRKINATSEAIQDAREEVNTSPTDAQKEAGNYKKGYVSIDGLDVSIENPNGSVRSGVDADGNAWSVTMQNDYGYIRGTKAVDGDHIDIFLSDSPATGNVYVVDAIDQQTGTFDESKVMYGFNSMEEARDAYLSNYSEGWKVGPITEVSKEEFKRWIDSSKRKGKPFSEYKSVKEIEAQNKQQDTANENQPNLLPKKPEKTEQEEVQVESKDKFVGYKEFIENLFEQEELSLTPYKNLSEWKEKDEEFYANRYDARIDEFINRYISYIKEISNNGVLQRIYDHSSLKNQKEIRDNLANAGLEYKDYIDTKVNRKRIPQKTDEKTALKEGSDVNARFYDGTIVSGTIESIENDKIGIRANNGRLYNVPLNRILDDDNNVLFRDNETLDEVNERFNQELQQQIDGTLSNGHIYSLGNPSDILLSTGIPNLPIELSSTRLAEKSAQRNHEFAISDVKNLPEALQSPIAVFSYGDKSKAQNVIVELDKNGKKFVVGLHLNQIRKGIEVNSIRGLFPKNNAEWLNWINQNKALYLNKEKIQALINKQRTNLADVEYLDLDSTTKIVENFENPKLEETNFREGQGSQTDASISLANDPASGIEGATRRSSKQQEEYAARERRRMENAANQMVEKLGLDNVEIVTDASTLEGDKAKAKGFYSLSTGKITVVIPNHKTVFDVEQTILHEAVAHYGLRRLFGDNFDTFLDNVYNNASAEVRERIDALAKKYNGNLHTATEEYLASLAERTDFENAVNSGWFNKIKEFFLKMLEKVGINLPELTDNELRYILWRSYENMAHPGRYSNVFDEAADLAMQNELKVGNYAEVYSSGNAAAEGVQDTKAVIANGYNGEKYYDHRLTQIEKGELISLAAAMQNHGSEINSPLSDIKDKRLISILQENNEKDTASDVDVLFRTSSVDELLDDWNKYVENGPQIYQISSEADIDRLPYNSFTKLELKDKLNDRRCTGAYSNRNGAIFLFPDHITGNVEELELTLWHETAHYASRQLGLDERLKNACLDYIKIRYPETYREITENYDRSRWPEEAVAHLFERKIKEFGAKKMLSSTFAGESDVAETFTQLINFIKNGKGNTQSGRDSGSTGNASGENVEGSTFRGRRNDVLDERRKEREGKEGEEGTTPISSETVKAWDKLASSNRFLLRETAVDYLTAVEKFQDFIARVSKKAIKDYENVYHSLLALSSRNKSEMDIFDSFIVKPLNEAIIKLTGKKKGFRKWNWDEGPLRDLVMYVYSKHGVERNRQVAVEKFIKSYQFDSFKNIMKLGIPFDMQAYVKELNEVKNKAKEDAYKKAYNKHLKKYIDNEISEKEASEKAKKAAKKDASNAMRKASRDFRNKVKSRLESEAKELLARQWEEKKSEIGQMNVPWSEKQNLLDEEAALIGADITKDYSGLSSMFKDDKWIDLSRDYVTKYENSHPSDNINGLWAAIKNATDFSLYKQYKSGLVSEEYVKNQQKRFDNYIPLRGFKDEIAGDVYNYIGKEYRIGNPVKSMEGRGSEADNPFGSILQIAYSSISSGNKNAAKQKLMNLVLNHNSDNLTVVNRAWKVKEDVLDEYGDLLVVPSNKEEEQDDNDTEWVEAVAKIPEGASPKEIEGIMTRFGEAMSKLKAEGRAEEIRKGSKIAYRTLYDERSSHQIPLYVGGEKYIITITGNPRLAQAVNGDLNPESESGWLAESGKRVNRTMAGLFTAKNAAFSLSNLSKDTIDANNQAFIKENPKWWWEFTKNQRAGFGLYPQMMKYLKMYNEGKMDTTDKNQALFKEFMDYGGATGYTFVETQKEYAEKLSKELNKLSSSNPSMLSPKWVYKTVFDAIEFAGQSAEIVNRFAAYKTSREMGRSITRSVIDAKEITVNFNRKGSGKKTAGKNTNTLINIAASISEYGRNSIIFWNANMQGKYRLYKNFKEHPVKTSTALVGNTMALGSVLLPLLNNLVLPALYSAFGLGSDDDDVDYFDALTDWERTHNLCVRLPKGDWLKVPIAPDMAPWLTMGDVIGAQVAGKREAEWTDFSKVIIDATSPFSINWSYEGPAFFINFAPSISEPLLQNMTNTNFMGNPIAKKPYSNRQAFDPKFKQVFRTTSPTLVELSRALNRIGGGNDVKASGKMTDWNPAYIQNLVSGYTGGYGMTFLSVADFITSTLKGESPEAAIGNFPIVDRFYISGTKDMKLRRVNSSYYKVRDFIDNMKHDVKGYEDEFEKAQKSGNVEKMAEYNMKKNNLMDSKDFSKLNELEQLDKQIRDYEKYLKEFPEDENVQKMVYDAKRRALEIMDEK